MRNLLQLFKGDRVIWVLLVLLTVYSGVGVASSVASLAYRDGGDATMHIVRHILFLGVGWLGIYVIHLIPYRWYNVLAWVLLAGSIVFLVYTLAKGVVLNDAARCLNLLRRSHNTHSPAASAWEEIAEMRDARRRGYLLLQQRSSHHHVQCVLNDSALAKRVR